MRAPSQPIDLSEPLFRDSQRGSVAILTLLAIGVLCGAFLYVAALGNRTIESTRARTAAEASALAAATILARAQNYQAFLNHSHDLLFPARWPAHELIDTPELAAWRKALEVLQQDLTDAAPDWAAEKGRSLGLHRAYAARGGVTLADVFPHQTSDGCKELAARSHRVHGLALIGALGNARFQRRLSALLPAAQRQTQDTQPVLGVACAEYYSQNFYPEQSPWHMDFRARLVPCDYGDDDNRRAVLGCAQGGEELIEQFFQKLALTQTADSPLAEGSGQP